MARKEGKVIRRSAAFILASIVRKIEFVERLNGFTSDDYRNATRRYQRIDSHVKVQYETLYGLIDEHSQDAWNRNDPVMTRAYELARR